VKVFDFIFYYQDIQWIFEIFPMGMTNERNILLMIELEQVNTWPVQILKILENRASFIKDEREREEQSLAHTY